MKATKLLDRRVVPEAIPCEVYHARMRNECFREERDKPGLVPG